MLPVLAEYGDDLLLLVLRFGTQNLQPVSQVAQLNTPLFELRFTDHGINNDSRNKETATGLMHFLWEGTRAALRAALPRPNTRCVPKRCRVRQEVPTGARTSQEEVSLEPLVSERPYQCWQPH